MMFGSITTYHTLSVMDALLLVHISRFGGFGVTNSPTSPGWQPRCYPPAAATPPPFLTTGCPFRHREIGRGVRKVVSVVKAEGWKVFKMTFPQLMPDTFTRGKRKCKWPQQSGQTGRFSGLWARAYTLIKVIQLQQLEHQTSLYYAAQGRQASSTLARSL